MADRIKFVLNTSVEYFNSPPPDDTTPIEEFFSNDELTILTATAGMDKILFAHELPQDTGFSLIFYKIPQPNLEQKNTSSISSHHAKIGLLTLEGGMVKSIYNSVSRVFSAHSSKRSEYSPELTNIIESLQTSLGNTLGLPDTGINSIANEINYWRKRVSQASTKSDKEAAKNFAFSLEKINEKLKLDKLNSSLSEVEEFLDFANNALDEIWRLPYQYPQNRMKGVLDLLSSTIINACIAIASNEDIWDANPIYVYGTMSQTKDIAESWIHQCDTLTRLFWANSVQHAWIGDSYVPMMALQLKERIDEIIEIKNTHNQVSTLFVDDEDQEIPEIEYLFSAFKGINVYDIGPLGQKRWYSAKKEFNHTLTQIDDKIAILLKGLIHKHLNNTRQVVHIFNKYQNVLSRETVKKALVAERENLLSTLPKLFLDLRDTLTQSQLEVGDRSQIVTESKWLKIVEQQLIEVQIICEFVLSDLSNYNTVNSQLKELLEETQAILKVNFQTWCERSIDAINIGELKLKENSPVVKFKDGEDQLMLVTFNPMFINFCNDVIEFEALGFRIPEQLKNASKHASKFITHARHLQQIAAFHNTVGDRMVPCQRPIMLKNAIELSRLVKSESVSWNDEESVIRYISMLQAAVNKLSHDNNLLTSYHNNAIQIIGKLMSTDLVRQSGNWKDDMRKLRDIIGNLERQGFTNLNPFVFHLDYQLYKVLEYQYITGLTDINNKLPDINIDLVFRQHQLQFRPTMEEIRSKYYMQLRKFLEKPASFRGLSEQNIFRVMIERNQHRFTTLYEAGDQILKKLETVKQTWIPWVALGCVDIDEICNQHLKTWEHWDANFKTCKHFSHQISKLQKTEERLECFVISLSPLRSDIEFISRRYWESLTYSLRASILDDVGVLQEYLTNALDVLQHIPIDEEGIINASAKYERITAEHPMIANVIQSVQSKDTCLAGWCKERVSALSNLLVQWDQLQPLIENHQSLLQGQLDGIKENLEIQILKSKEETEKFVFLWEATLKDLEGSDTTDISLYKERQNQWKMIQDKRDHLLSECTKFNVQFPAEVLQVFERVEKDFKTQSEQWEIYENFVKEQNDIAAEEWTVYRRRPYTLTDFISKWESRLANVPVSISRVRIQNNLARIRNNLPIITTLQSDSLIEKHWAKISSLLSISAKSYHEMTLNDVLDAMNKIEENKTELQNIVRQATSEQIVRQAITELEQWGATASLKAAVHVDSRGNSLAVIRDFQEILHKIGDHQSLLQSAKNSVAFDSFSDQAEIWETKLTNLDYILMNLNQIQRKWIYLEPIFSVGTLKNEETIFMRIDKDFRYIMREIEHDGKILSLLKINNIMAIINALINQLTRCQNTLTTYITAKRNTFARFYFLGDDDLLEILGQSSKEAIIQKHIKKIFPGVHRLGIMHRDNISFITTIYSAEGDEIKLKNDVCMRASVEEWFNQLVLEIQNTMRDLILQCCQYDEITLDQIKKYPMQVICLVNLISFTKRTEKAISSMTLQNHLKFIKNSISKYSLMLQQTNRTGTDNHLIQIKIRALLLDLVCQATTIEYLLKHNVTNLHDWYWLQQLKFYAGDKDGVVRVKMVYATFEYSYEFLGNFNKLVYTSLAHNCYLTLTQAMYLGLGGNPFGRAGTGKTECVKALGAMLGRLVFVFNCDENIDTAAMALILSGLARCGAWGCFDEFNRLQDSTLSAISMLIQPLQTALKEQKKEVCLLEENIQLNQHCCIFVTLNPAGAEYGGRQQLPANLQALFRPIVMQQPEPKEIARVLLFVEGFKYAEDIGDKIVELFDLAEKILSSQRHYDWGLRELKTVLQGCGKILESRENEIEMQEEMEIAVQALKSNTMSKLTMSDAKRFNMLIADVFPNTTLASSGHEQLREKIQEAFSTNGLICNERQIQKCVELYEQLQKRMGVVVYGPPDSGKTVIISLLKDALTSLGKTIRTYIISPKSMNRTQLLGTLDPDTRQWNEGVLTTTAMAVTSEPLSITSWIICDGEIDPEWVEALNSVLDDNRLLTLPSGWRIQFGHNVNFIFETHDLSNASPATISRMGIINLSPEDLNHTLIIESWVSKQTNSDDLQYFTENYFYKTLKWIEENQKCPDFTTMVGFIKCGLQTLAATTASNKDEFCINMLRGFSSVMDFDVRNELANKIFQWADIYVHNPDTAEYCYYNGFRGVVEVYETDEFSTAYEENVLIKTPSVKVNSEVVRAFLRAEDKPLFLLVGLNGSGKSLLLQNIISEFSGYQLITIHCSAQITSNYVAHIIKQNCITISGVRGKEYRPKLSRLVLYLKNIELCPIDNWNTSEVIELLLQITNRNGFYSETLEWISVSGLQICGSLSSITKHNLSARLLAKAKCLMIGYPSEIDMQKIVQCLLVPVLDKYKITMKKLNADQLAFAMINVYMEINSQFSSNQSHHYRFSPKLLQQWIQGLQYYPVDKFENAIFYEIERIIGDRLIKAQHREQFDVILTSAFRTLDVQQEREEHYFAPLSAKSSNLEHHSKTQWQEIVTRTISIANAESIFIDSPVTDELLMATSSLCRALSRPKTNITLCGRAGSGRCEALTLATTLLNVKLFSPTPTAGYGIIDFYNDLKVAMQMAAIENEVVAFMIDQIWVSYAKDLMKPIEAILNGSEIPDLFGEEVEPIAASLKNAAQMEGYQDSLVAYFNKRLADNLHMVLVLEVETKDLQELFDLYPVTYLNTEIFWFKELSGNTMKILPKLVVNNLEPHQGNDPVQIPSLFDCLENIETKWSLSPKRHIHLIKTYYYCYNFMNNQQTQHYNKLKKGVDKLSEAQGIVDKLKSEAVEQEKAVQEKRHLANRALEMISATMRTANSQKVDLLELKKQTEESSKTLIFRKKAIEEELSLVEPILREASAAVGQIKSEALSEIRSLRAPPETIRDILEGVLRIMGIRDTSWNSMKTFLAKRGVKEDIRSLDPSRITPENCQAVEKLLKSKSDSFDERNAKRASAAAAPLAAWVKANVQYSKVTQSIRPLEREQNELQLNLNQAEAEMASLTTGLDDVNAKVKELTDQLNMYTQEAAILEIKLTDARNTLSTASVLIEKLSNEYSSWSKELKDINNEIQKLSSKAFLVSFCIVHLSDLFAEQRTDYLKTLSSFLDNEMFTIDKVLLENQDRIIFESMGLTCDQQSMENAALILQMLNLPYGTCPVPLIIDPTGHCFKWLQNFLASCERSFDISLQYSDRFTYNLELAVRFGKVFIVREGHKIIPPLLALLHARTYNRFAKKMIQVGGKLVDLHENFRIILITTFTNITLGGDIHPYITPMYFTTTELGFTDQLMSKWIVLKKPELEQKRIELLRNEGELLQKKAKLQDQLLEELSTAQGDILKNEQLFITLNNIKASTTSIEESLKQSVQVRNKLMEGYNAFKPICSNSAHFYVGINRMYNLTTSNFAQLFLKAASSDETSDTEVVYKKLVQQTYITLSRSVARKDKIALGLNICKHAFPDSIVPEKEWELFVFNFMAIDNFVSDNFIEESLPNWIPAEAIPKLHNIKSQVPALFSKLQLSDDHLWRSYLNANKYVEIPLKITEFQRILMTQIFRPDFLVPTMLNSISRIIGIKNLSTHAPAIKQVVGDSKPDEPILIIANTGTDPSTDIKEFALRNKKEFIEISIGRGQEKHTLSRVRQAAEEGKWICIKNVHLAPNWLTSLNDEFKIAQLHQEFRLWMICESDVGFSSSFTNNCLKVIHEQPVGIKNKIKGLFEQYSNVLHKKLDPKYIKPHVALFILHAIILERRIYAPQGWCKSYDFGEPDLKAALAILENILTMNASSVNWPVLRGMCEKIAYGGRIDYLQDFLKLEELLLEFFDPNILSNRWSPLNLPIILVNSQDINEYTGIINGLPEGESPELIGLCTSTNISKDIIFCRTLLKDLRSKYFNVDEVQSFEKRIKPILSLWKKLVSVTTVMKTYETMKGDEVNDPWIIFEISELTLAGKVFNVIHKALARLHSVMKDLNTMSKVDIDLMKCLGENQVPLEWKKLWNGPKLVTDYIKSVVHKGVAAERRYKMKDQLSGEVNFSDIFSVKTFLATLKLIQSRDLGVSTNNLKLTASFNTSKKSTTSIIVSPLKIDGAFFKAQKLVLQDGETRTSSFELNFIPSKNYKIPNTDTLDVPLYNNLYREDLICTIQVQIIPSKAEIIYSGAAFVIPEIQ